MGEVTSVSNKYGKKIAIVTGIAGAIIVIATGLYVINRTNSNQAVGELTPEVTKKKIESVSALGRIEPLDEVINVTSTPSIAGSKVQELLVSPRSVVKKGDIIAITSDYDLQKAQLERVKKELLVAQSNLAIVQAGAKQGTIDAQKATIDRLKVELTGAIATDEAKINRLQAQLATETTEKQATIDRLQAEVNNAQVEFKRYQQLAQDGVISASDLDARELTLQTSKQRYQEAQASFARSASTIKEEIKEAQALAIQRENTLQKQIREANARLDEIAEVRTVDVAQAQAEVAQAQAMIKQAEIELELTIIKAPSDGTIIDVISHQGESIDNAQGVVEMADTSRMVIVAEVYESDISKIKLGQKANIISENNSFPDRITGEVVEISSKIGKKDVLETDPAASVDARVVEVKIAVTPEYVALVQNLIYSQVIVEILL